jgi:(p)ppGpp synthase/HD superfamily hydrolase
MSPENELLLAIHVAHKAHAGQFRNDGATPYIVHPEAVANKLEGHLLKAVAFLHDVLEDTDVTVEDLKSLGFSRDVIEAVVVLTKVKGQSYDEYLERVKSNHFAKMVKIVDMISNLNDKPTWKQIQKYSKGLNYLVNLHGV